MPKKGQQRGTAQRRAELIDRLRWLGEGEECMYWPWSDIRGQYVTAHIDGELWRVHRWVYEQIHGVRLGRGSVGPGERVVMHACDNPACIRPSHLALGSQADNIRDAINKRRLKARVGDGIHTKLSIDRVIDIRALADNGVRYSLLARVYGVSPSTIADIAKRRTRTGSPHQKLSDVDKEEIRRMAAKPGVRQAHIARAFGVSDAAISHILHGRKGRSSERE